MNIESLKQQITSKEIGCDVYFQEEVTSTNTLAKELAIAGKPSGTLVVTDFQSQGKGRRGKTWIAPKGKDIFMSLLLRPAIRPTKAPMLTLVMGLSVAQAVNDYLGVDAKIKWPNDVVVKAKKICGILTEMNANATKVDYVVIGTGINCNETEFAKAGLADATSLLVETGKEIEREALLAKVLAKFETNYNEFLQTQDLTCLMSDYNSLLANSEREVRVCGAGEEWTGTAMGINEQGELLVEDANGEMRTIFTGEVSVRGIYGYV
jgi:birA, biotin-[acetyl-CoA-carboxylase] ligase region